MKEIRVQKWYLMNNLTQEQYQAVQNGYQAEMIKETEKAVYLNLMTDFGNIKAWFPKKAIEQEQTAPEFKVGQQVNHRVYGVGIVIESVNGIAKVQFNGSVKSIVASYLKEI